MNRLLTKSEFPPRKWHDALNRMFGSDGWKRAFYHTRSVKSLFGDEDMLVRDADLKDIGNYFVSRLRTVFAAVADNPLPLRNSRNIPLFLMCFAAGNPKGAPTALKIARDILKR